MPVITLRTPDLGEQVTPSLSVHPPKGTSALNQVAPTTDKARNLVVCIDGTSNKFSEKSTNVVELYNHIEKSDSQLTYYNSGVGTYAKPSWRFYTHFKNVASKTMDMAIAWNFEEVIIGAYRWLADNYRPKDKIFLFGFSRGAYQARALAAMIETAGLIYAGNVEQIPFAWELYASNDPGLKTFKETFSRPNVDLHFLGAWDTVSSIGLFLRDVLPITDRCGHITHFRHALALDERRARFLPEFVVDSPKEGGTKKEVWFAGTHSDIGGGNKLNRSLDLGAEPLRWMMKEALAHGLRIVRLHKEKTGIPDADVTESLRLVWWIFEGLPISRRSYDIQGKSSTSRWPMHRGHGRKVLPGQFVHWTVRAGLNQDENTAGSRARQRHNYQPKASVRREDFNSRLEWAKSTTGICIPKIDPLDLLQQKPTMPAGAVGWEGGKTLIAAIDLIKKWRDPGTPNGWLQELSEYTTGDGKPELIWHYGGPELLHDLVLNQDALEAEKIIRSVIGLRDPELNMEVISISGYTWNDTPAFVLLREWVAPDPSPGNPISNTSGLLSKALLSFKPKPNSSAEPHAEKARWGLEYIPRASRSNKLAIIAADVVLATLKLEQFRARFSGDSENVQVVLSLISPDITDGARSEKKDAALAIDVVRKALDIVAELDPNRLFSNPYHWDQLIPKIMTLLTVEDRGSVVPIFKALTTLAHSQQCAHIIVGHGKFPSLWTHLRDQTHAESVMSTLAMLIKARGPAHPLSSDRQAGQYSQDYDRRVIASITSSVIDDLVGIMTDEGHPASAKTLPLIESISKLGLLVPAEPGAASTSADRVVERSFDLMSENPVALEILNGFASKHESVRVKLVQGDISERIIQLLKHVDPQVVIKACDLIGKLLDQSTQGSQLPPNVSLELVTPLDSNQDEVLRAALDVAKILASRSMSAEQAFIDKLISIARGGRHQYIVLAILGRVNSQELDQDIGNSFIPSYVRMMNDNDGWLAQGAISGLITQAENDHYRTLMHSEGVVDQLTRLFKQALKRDALRRQDMEGVIIHAFELTNVLSRDDATRADLIRLGVVKHIYQLSEIDSPANLVSEARDTLVAMGREYGDVQSVVNEYERNAFAEVVTGIFGGVAGLGGSAVHASQEALEWLACMIICARIIAEDSSSL